MAEIGMEMGNNTGQIIGIEQKWDLIEIEYNQAIIYTTTTAILYTQSDEAVSLIFFLPLHWLLWPSIQSFRWQALLQLSRTHTQH